ncbi:MAG TPA: cyclase family protein [Acidimicrobiia bacterium]|jgi:kynurenine formamidase
MDDGLPTYRQLLRRDDAPSGSSWGVWGANDQLGTLNLLTDERTRRAAALVTRGAVFPLNLPLHELDPQLAWRTPVEHHILHVGHEARDVRAGGVDDASQGHFDRDDYLDGLWLQGGSQWDGLTHVRHREHGNYNGVADADIHGGPGTRLGIDQWAKRAIVGRGVLLDIPGYRAAAGLPYEVDSSYQVTVADLDSAAGAQGVTIEMGDILLLHTGWLAFLLAENRSDRERLMEHATLRSPGLEPSYEMLEWIWDNRLAAIVSDNGGVESMAPDPQFFLHLNLLPLLGMPIGEFWDLDALAADCAADGAYEFLFVSIPLPVRGGVGSPSQAVALK